MTTDIRQPAATPTESQIPEGLPGFDQAQRFWERDTSRWTVKLLPGECYVTRHD